jgi:hypothetical protein
MSAVFLLAGATLLVTWLVSPADSAPPARVPAARTTLDEAAPLLADMNAEVDHMRDRLVTKPPSPVPTRDPFTYGHRVVQPRASRPDPIVATTPLVLLPTPTLVAILSGDATAPRRAVFSTLDTDDVQFLTSGDTIGRFVVSEIQDDLVMLTDRRTDETVRLTLR